MSKVSNVNDTTKLSLLYFVFFIVQINNPRWYYYYYYYDNSIDTAKSKLSSVVATAKSDFGASLIQHYCVRYIGIWLHVLDFENLSFTLKVQLINQRQRGLFYQRLCRQSLIIRVSSGYIDTVGEYLANLNLTQIRYRVRNRGREDVCLMTIHETIPLNLCPAPPMSGPELPQSFRHHTT
jgi:hypothetical protein